MFSLDVLRYIFYFIDNDKDKCRYLRTCIKISDFSFHFYDIIDIEKIIKSKWFDRFINVRFGTDMERLSRTVSVIYDNDHIIVNRIISSNVKYLTFSARFNRPIKGLFPLSVTHLDFGDWFNQSVKSCISPSVTHLIFSKDFNKTVYGRIPSSVTHLTFGDHFNRSIYQCIPSSVTHLTFGLWFFKNIRGNIPTSVTHLVFMDYFSGWDNNDIPISITHLTLGGYIEERVLLIVPTSVIKLNLLQNADKDRKRYINDGFKDRNIEIIYGK